MVVESVPVVVAGFEGEVGEKVARKRMNAKEKGEDDMEGRVWVSFHEGFSNAVRKPITMEELMRGL